MLGTSFLSFTLLSLVLPTTIALRIRDYLTDQHLVLIQCFSLLLLGMFLATLATLNFSLSLFVGLLSTPLSFIGPTLDSSGSEVSRKRNILATIGLQILSPPAVLWSLSWSSGTSISYMLSSAAFGWKVNGMWTQVVVWCIWWPAWLTGSVLTSVRL